MWDQPIRDGMEGDMRKPLPLPRIHFSCNELNMQMMPRGNCVRRMHFDANFARRKQSRHGHHDSDPKRSLMSELKHAMFMEPITFSCACAVKLRYHLWNSEPSGGIVPLFTSSAFIFVIPQMSPTCDGQIEPLMCGCGIKPPNQLHVPISDGLHATLLLSHVAAKMGIYHLYQSGDNKGHRASSR